MLRGSRDGREGLLQPRQRALWLSGGTRTVALALVVTILVGQRELQAQLATLQPPIAGWSLDGNAQDCRGSNHGVLMGFKDNAVTFVPGVVGEAVHTDGVNDVVATPLRPNFQNGITYELWVRTSLNVPAVGIVLTNGGGVSSAESGCGIRVTAGNIEFNGNNGVSGQTNFYLIGPTIANQGYQHIVATWTGNTAANGVKLYVNSVLVGQATALRSVAQASRGLDLGAHAHFGFHLQADIDRVRVYDQVLSPNQIRTSFLASSLGMSTCHSRPRDRAPLGQSGDPLILGTSMCIRFDPTRAARRWRSGCWRR